MILTAGQQKSMLIITVLFHESMA